MERHYQPVALSREASTVVHFAPVHDLLKGLGLQPVVARCWGLTVLNFGMGDLDGAKRQAKTWLKNVVLRVAPLKTVVFPVGKWVTTLQGWGWAWRWWEVKMRWPCEQNLKRRVAVAKLGRVLALSGFCRGYVIHIGLFCPPQGSWMWMSLYLSSEVFQDPSDLYANCVAIYGGS